MMEASPSLAFSPGVPRRAYSRTDGAPFHCQHYVILSAWELESGLVDSSKTQVSSLYFQSIIRSMSACESGGRS